MPKPPRKLTQVLLENCDSMNVHLLTCPLVPLCVARVDDRPTLRAVLTLKNIHQRIILRKTFNMGLGQKEDLRFYLCLQNQHPKYLFLFK